MYATFLDESMTYSAGVHTQVRGTQHSGMQAWQSLLRCRGVLMQKRQSCSDADVVCYTAFPQFAAAAVLLHHASSSV